MKRITPLLPMYKSISGNILNKLLFAGFSRSINGNKILNKHKKFPIALFFSVQFPIRSFEFENLSNKAVNFLPARPYSPGDEKAGNENDRKQARMRGLFS